MQRNLKKPKKAALTETLTAAGRKVQAPAPVGDWKRALAGEDPRRHSRAS